MKRTVPRVCRTCGGDFLANPYQLSIGKDLTCSAFCGRIRPAPPASVISDDGLTARIALRGIRGDVRAYATVDAADVEWADRWRWHLDKDGYAMRNSEPINGKRRSIYLHRELLGLSPGDGIEGDHINRDHLDCRRVNLRPLPKIANAQNQSSYRGSSSRHRGVSWNKTKRAWTAHIRIEGRLKYLGQFADEHAAAEVAREARLRLMPFAID